MIVLDTSLLVSGLLRSHSKPATILSPELPFSSEQIRALLDQIEAEGVAVVANPMKFPLPDPDDEPFLEVAVATRADALVTGNIRHYPGRARHGIPVVDPAAFLDRWIRQPRR